MLPGRIPGPGEVCKVETRSAISTTRVPVRISPSTISIPGARSRSIEHYMASRVAMRIVTFPIDVVGDAFRSRCYRPLAGRSRPGALFRASEMTFDWLQTPHCLRSAAYVLAQQRRPRLGSMEALTGAVVTLRTAFRCQLWHSR